MKVQVVSFSEIDTLRQCPHKHELAYKERWVGPVTGPALSRGILWHQVLEAHYKVLMRADSEGWTNAKALMMARREVNKLIVGTHGYVSEDAELIGWMYDGHVEHYGADENWRILAVEHAPEVWLPTPRGTRSMFKLKLKIDLIVRERDTKLLWLVDHKSGKDLPNNKEHDIDDQFGLYAYAMRTLGHPVFGSIHSAARTQRNKDQAKHFQPLHERFRRHPMARTDQELDTIAIEAYRTIRAGYAVPIGEAPRSPNPDTCRWRCDYTEPCLMGRKTDARRERQLLRDMGYVQNFERH
jgi:hypothetical protein